SGAGGREGTVMPGNGTSDSSTGAGGVVRNGQPARSRGVSKYSDEVDDGSSAGAGGSVGIVSTRGSAIPGTAPTPGSIAVAGPASASAATAIADAVTRPATRCGERDCRVLLTGHESTSGVRGPGPWPAGRYSLPVPKLAARQPSPAAVARHRRPPAVAPGAAARQPSPLAPPPVALAEICPSDGDRPAQPRALLEFRRASFMRRRGRMPAGPKWRRGRPLRQWSGRPRLRASSGSETRSASGRSTARTAARA